jgi:acyl-CoA synthetase (AMP-forming)/AMP-acid ligase II
MREIEQLPTMVHVLAARAAEHGERNLFTYVEDDTPRRSMTYAAVHRAACSIAASLSAVARRGERAVLIFPVGADFAPTFFGCLYAGLVAVPVYPPDPSRLARTLPKLRAIVKDAGVTVALTTQALLAFADVLFEHAPELRALRWIAVDALPEELGAAWVTPPIGGETLAFLQYTSGSTGAPKGVMVTHANLVENERHVRRAFHHTEGFVMAGWLPTYHDMGLIGQFLQPLFVGGSCHSIAPVEFLQRPVAWLRLLTACRADTSGAPNFGYDLCARKVTDEDKRGLDLSHWKLAYNGAEVVRAETLERFTRAFAPCGFRPETFFPCYGLAESTLFVAGVPFRAGANPRRVRADALEAHRVVALEGEPTADDMTRTLVPSGVCPPEQRVVVVDPERLTLCEDDTVGEVWIAGPCVARGYWNQSAETERIFRAHLASGEGPFLRTGDLGSLHRGELTLTGRLKDLIILHGRNHYPHDLEASAEAAHPDVRSGCSAAFSMDGRDEERLALVVEVESRSTAQPSHIVAAVVRRVAEEHGVRPYAVVLVPPRTVPKTSSGKVRRAECRALFARGELVTLSVVGTDAPIAPARAPDAIEGWLRQWLAARLECHPDTFDIDAPLESFGLDSSDEILLTGDLRAWLGRSVKPTEVYENPTIRCLARHLAEGDCSR